MTILIIEGCDASGKSTLIKELSKMLPDYVVKKGSSFEHSTCTQQQLAQKFYEMINESEDELLSWDEHIIFDRFIYSNEVYASLYEDYAILSHTERRAIEYDISLEATIIYLYASPEVLTERLNTRGDAYVKADRIPAILAKYDQSLLQVDKNIPILSFDTEAMSTMEIVQEIAKHLIKQGE